MFRKFICATPVVLMLTIHDGNVVTTKPITSLSFSGDALFDGEPVAMLDVYTDRLFYDGFQP